MKIKTLFLNIFFLSFLSACSTQSRLPSDVEIGPVVKLPNGLFVHDFKLKNKLRILIVPNDEAPVFTFQLWVKVGAMDEFLDPELRRTGLAHFFEHMMFRGTAKYPGNSYTNILTRAGAVGLNATTSKDRTNYYLSLPKDKLELVLKLESDRFKNLIINKNLFEKERGAVLGELKLSLDRPQIVSYQKLKKLIFEKHPYKEKIIGKKKSIETFTVDEALYFFKKYYSPNNFTIILTGDLKINHTLRLVKKYFADMKARSIAKYPVPKLPVQKRKKVTSMRHPATKINTLLIGYRATMAEHVDAAPLLLTSAILGDGKGSILYKSLVDAGLASSVAVYSSSNRAGGSFIIVVQMAANVSKGKVLHIVKKALNKLKRGKLSPAEIERAKNWTLLEFYKRLSSNEGLAYTLGEGMLSSKSSNYMRRFKQIEQLKTLSAQDIIRVSSYYLSDRKSNIVFMKPKGK